MREEQLNEPKLLVGITEQRVQELQLFIGLLVIVLPLVKGLPLLGSKENMAMYKDLLSEWRKISNRWAQHFHIQPMPPIPWEKNDAGQDQQ